MRKAILVGVAVCIAAVGSTLSASPASAEPGPACSTAQSLANNTSVTETLSSSTDKDTYKVSVPSAQWVQFNLNLLPANYGFELLKSDCTVFRTVNAISGRAPERTFFKAAAGTIYVRVYGVSGAFSSTRYRLQQRLLGNRVTVVDARTGAGTYPYCCSDSYSFAVGEVFNGTTSTRTVNAVQYMAKDTTTGEPIAYPRDGGSSMMLAPGQTAPFYVEHKYEGAKLYPMYFQGVASQVASCSFANLSYSGSMSTDDQNVNAAGTMTNKGTSTAYWNAALISYRHDGLTGDFQLADYPHDYYYTSAGSSTTVSLQLPKGDWLYSVRRWTVCT